MIGNLKNNDMDTWQLCPKCKGEKGSYVANNPLNFGWSECNICAATGLISVFTGLPPTSSGKFQFTVKGNTLKGALGGNSDINRTT